MTEIKCRVECTWNRNGICNSRWVKIDEIKGYPNCMTATKSYRSTGRYISRYKYAGNYRNDPEYQQAQSGYYGRGSSQMYERQNY